MPNKLYSLCLNGNKLENLVANYSNGKNQIKPVYMLHTNTHTNSLFKHFYWRQIQE